MDMLTIYVTASFLVAVLIIWDMHAVCPPAHSFGFRCFPLSTFDPVKNGFDPTLFLCYNVLHMERRSRMRDTITIRLPEKLQRDLAKVVKAEKTSKSDVIREALERYLALKRFQQLRKKVLPFAEAEGLVTDEDVFKTIS